MRPAVIVCNAVVNIFHCIAMYYNATHVVSMKRPRLFIYLTVVLSSTIWVINNCFLPQGSSMLDFFICFYALILTVLFSRRSQRWQGAVTMTMLLLTQIAAMYVVSFFAFPIAQRLGIPSAELTNTTTSFGNAIMSFICLCLLVPAYHLVGRLLIYLFQGGRLSPMLLCFFPIPISQGIFMNMINRIIPHSGTIDGIQTAYVLASLLAVAADIGFFVGIRKIQHMSRLQDQVRLINEQLDVQIDYYRQLQDSILMVNQIRHDLNNQLQAAYHLLETGETALVRQQLDQVQDSLRQRVGPRYSSNLMVDAVLQDKARRCRDSGICLNVSAALPASLPIENAQLCSIFSNLLDNSIQGALESGAEEKEITLESAVRNSCLIIQCTNPALQPKRNRSRDPLRTHGLGLEILGRIADQYHGSLNTEYQDGRFHAALCLPFPKTAEEESTYA